VKKVNNKNVHKPNSAKMIGLASTVVTAISIVITVVSWLR